MAGKRDRETVVRGVVPNIGIDSFIDEYEHRWQQGIALPRLRGTYDPDSAENGGCSTVAVPEQG